MFPAFILSWFNLFGVKQKISMYIPRMAPDGNQIQWEVFDVVGTAALHYASMNGSIVHSMLLTLLLVEGKMKVSEKKN